ncbi:Spondin-1 [Apis mellifera carnica]|nr:Spondin-1 [Apis mellifera carnica]
MKRNCVSKEIGNKKLKGHSQIFVAVGGNNEHKCIKMFQTHRRHDYASFQCRWKIPFIHHSLQPNRNGFLLYAKYQIQCDCTSRQNGHYTAEIYEILDFL